MSLLQRNKLCIVLRPDRIEIARMARSFRPKLMEVSDVACEPVVSNQASWSAPLAALKQYLSANDGGANVTLILSNHFVRYALVPWSDALINDEERLMLARICFEQIYGDLSRDWDIRISSASYGKPCIASAIDQGLINGIKESFIGRSARLQSLQPWLMTAVNQYGSNIKEDKYRVLIAEPGQIAMLHSDRGQPAEVRSTMIREELGSGLELLMQRESAIHALDKNERPYLIVTGFAEAEIAPAITRKFQVLKPGKKLNSVNAKLEQHAMALCGVSA